MIRSLRNQAKQRRSGSPASVALLQLLVGTVLISFSGVFVKLVDVGPTVSGFYRNALGAAALLIFTFVRREPLWRGWTPLGYAVLAGVLFAADIFVWHRSILYIGPGLATILGNFQVFLLAIVGTLFFKERMTWRFAGSVMLAFVGLGMLVGVDWSVLDSSYRKGVVLGLLTAVAYASYLLTLRRAHGASPRLDTTSNLAILSAVCAAALGVSAFVEAETLRIPNLESAVILAAYGIVCQAFGWVLIAAGIRRIQAARAGLILLLQPTLTFIWDILFFQRPTTRLEALGALVALVAIYLGSTSFSSRPVAPARKASE